MGLLGAFCAALGVVCSGPLALWLVRRTQAQPAWYDARLFAENYHPIQALPFLGGFFLVVGFVLLVVSLHVLARASQFARTLCALVFVSVFAALVGMNYVLQTTFVPNLVQHYAGRGDSLLEAFSMANPHSLAWGLEIWGYGFLGIATWLVGPVCSETRLERALQHALTVNGAVSVFAVLLTLLNPAWVSSAAGLLAFALWNVLIAALAVLAVLVFRGRLRTLDDPSEPRCTLRAARAAVLRTDSRVRRCPARHRVF